MSEVKVKEKYLHECGSTIHITAVGVQGLLGYAENGQSEEQYSLDSFLVYWTKTHEADGTAVEGEAEETGERRCVICWDNYPATYPERNCFPGRRVSEAVGVKDFIAFEFEDGYRSRVSPTYFKHRETGMHLDGGPSGWPTEDYYSVRAVAVILSKEGE